MPSTNDLATLIEMSDDVTWVQQAACGSLDIDALDMFFVDAGKSLSSEAAAMCSGCPVRTECLQHSYEREITGGYFGGVSPSKRRRISLAEAIGENADS